MAPLRFVLGLAVLLLVSGCSGSEQEPRRNPAAGELQWSDPMGDAEPYAQGSAAPAGVGDLLGASVDLDGDQVRITVAVAKLAELGSAVRQEFTLGEQEQSSMLSVVGVLNDGSEPRVTVRLQDNAAETIRDLCRDRTEIETSFEDGVLRLRVPLGCLPGDRLSLTDPFVAVDVKDVSDDREFTGFDSLSLSEGDLVVEPS